MSEADQSNAKSSVNSTVGSDHAFDDLTKAFVDAALGGLASYNSETGSLEKGHGIRATDEAVGEVTGKNMQRKAMMDAKDAVSEEKQNRANQLKDEQTRKFQKDVSSSSAAQATRDTGAALTKNYLGSPGPEKDFLGL